MEIPRVKSASAAQKQSFGFVPGQDGEPDLLCNTATGACTLPSDYHRKQSSASPVSDQTYVEGYTSTPNPETVINLDGIISRVLLFNQEGGKSDQRLPLIPEPQMAMLCRLTTKVFLLQSSLLELSPADTGLTVIGDLHGHLSDLCTIFTKEGSPDIHNYLFLGNYVDTGRHQLELLALLFCYKVKYPENFFLLRGAHESRETNKTNGFWHKCRTVYSENIWNVFNGCFDAMPLAAVLGDRIFCVHSGLSPDLQSLSQLRSIRRPVNIPANGILYDLLWAAPTIATPGWNVSEQGTWMVFGKGASKRFFKTNDLEFMIRGHAASDKGYILSPDRKVLSIFSATNYEERVNQASFAHIGVNLTIQVYTFDHNGICQEKNLLE